MYTYNITHKLFFFANTDKYKLHCMKMSTVKNTLMNYIRPEKVYNPEAEHEFANF